MASLNTSDSTRPFLARLPRVRRDVIALLVVFLASGVLANDVSYVIVLALLIAGFRLSGPPFSNRRKILLTLTLALVAFGSIKGFLIGNDVGHIARFALPLLAFAAITAMPGLGLLLFQARVTVLAAIGLMTPYFFYTVRSGDVLAIESYMAGWTVTYSSGAGISVWHYFCFPFFMSAIYAAFSGDKRSVSWALAALSVAMLALLLVLTDTSAFALALGFCIFLIFSPRLIARLASVLAVWMAGLLIIDFLTLKIVCSKIVGIAEKLSIADSGDSLRLIQLEYFVQNSEFFGSGFGARHDFPLEINYARQLSQIIYPYASELPIANILYNGGILAGIWFFAFVYIIYVLVKRVRLYQEREICLFALCCASIFVGSLSNPFLFAPASMLLLAVMFDIFDFGYASKRDAAAPRVPQSSSGMRRHPQAT